MHRKNSEYEHFSRSVYFRFYFVNKGKYAYQIKTFLYYVFCSVRSLTFFSFSTLLLRRIN